MACLPASPEITGGHNQRAYSQDHLTLFVIGCGSLK